MHTIHSSCFLLLIYSLFRPSRFARSSRSKSKLFSRFDYSLYFFRFRVQKVNDQDVKKKMNETIDCFQVYLVVMDVMEQKCVEMKKTRSIIVAHSFFSNRIGRLWSIRIKRTGKLKNIQLTLLFSISSFF